MGQHVGIVHWEAVCFDFGRRTLLASGKAQSPSPRERDRTESMCCAAAERSEAKHFVEFAEEVGAENDDDRHHSQAETDLRIAINAFINCSSL